MISSDYQLRLSRNTCSIGLLYSSLECRLSPSFNVEFPLYLIRRDKVDSNPSMLETMALADTVSSPFIILPIFVRVARRKPKILFYGFPLLRCCHDH